MTNQNTRTRASGGEKGSSNPRARIVAATRKLLAEEGYEGVTMKQIAREAGVAQGLIHYYFSSKDELLLELLMEVSREYAEENERLAASSPPGKDLATAALENAKHRASRNPELLRLRYELFALGLRKPDFLPGVAAMLQSGRENIVKTLAGITGEHEDAKPSPEREALAAVLLSCFSGLALQKMADPEGFDLDAAYAILWRLAQAEGAVQAP
jgi:AcrR family transcriptional regulator